MGAPDDYPDDEKLSAFAPVDELCADAPVEDMFMILDAVHESGAPVLDGLSDR